MSLHDDPYVGIGPDGSELGGIADLSLDMAELTDYVPYVEEAPADVAAEPDPQRRAWLLRRESGFGASEVAIVLVALGMRSPDILASYQEPHANLIRIRMHKRAKAVAVPRIFLQKAGFPRARPLKMTDTQRLGIEREPELVRQWRMRLVRGTAGPDAELIDPSTVQYVPELRLPELLPIVDREQPRMLCTPDILARDILGALGCVDGKCSYEPYGPKYSGPPEHARIQVNVQMGVCGAEWGGVLEGEGWSATYRDHAGEPTGNVVTWAVQRDEALIVEARKACALGWERVEELRAQREEMAA